MEAKEKGDYNYSISESRQDIHPLSGLENQADYQS